MNSKKNVPSKINKKFLSRSVDAAFISSIRAKNFRHVNLGIIAKKEVRSVLVKPHASYLSDSESETSNVLAKILGFEGEVVIGDKALRYYHGGGEHIDLAKIWHVNTGLPFVFALLCYHTDRELYKKIEVNFLRQKVKIPHYILKQAANKSGIVPKDILEYLGLISYKVDTKALQGLKRFYKLAQELPR